MANSQATTTTWLSPNFTGELYMIGANQTPFLSMIGGLQGGNVRTTKGAVFPLAQPWALNSASQPSISENASLTAPTAWTYIRGEDVNTVQIIQKAVKVSYLKQSTTSQLYVATTHVNATDQNPVTDELQFQINGALEQAAVDVEYTFLNGSYIKATSADVAGKTRGIITACSTNSVAASSARMSKALMNELLRTMAGNGSRFKNPVAFMNAFQKQMISDIYGYAPQDRNVGGLNIKQVETDFCMLGIVYAPYVATSHMLVADMAYCSPVYCPVPEKGNLFYEELSRTGAGLSGQLYGQIGLDYGPEEFHGKITGLATS